MALSHFNDTHYVSEADYLAYERDAEFKHEFANGEIFAMTGASPRHNQISANIITAFNLLLRDKPWIVYTGDMRIKVKQAASYRYPDVAVICDNPPIIEGEAPGSLVNPTVLVEVLSESTGKTDHNEKLREYTRIDSLHAYLIVSQDEPRVEYYLRQAKGWLYDDVVGIASSMTLSALDCTLALAEVYRKVEFNPDPSDKNTRG